MSQFECTVIIPSHNSLGFLKEAISSVMMQDLTLEIIVVDDGSNDGTAEWLLTQPHIRALRTEKIGASGARNVAINAASCDLIAFLDADDLWWPGKLKAQLAFHRDNPKTSLSFTDYVHFNEEGQLLGNCFEFWKVSPRHFTPYFTQLKEAEAEILAINMIGTSTVMARRDALLAIGGYSTNLTSAEDWDLWLKLAKIGEVGVLNAVKTSYLVRKGSITSDTSKRIKAVESIIAPFANSSNQSIQKAFILAIARLNIARGEQNLKEKRYFAALKNHLMAFKTLKDIWTLRVAFYDITLLLGFNRKEYTR